MDSLFLSAIRAVRSVFTQGMLEIFVKSILATVAALIVFVVGSGLFFTWLAHVLQGHAIANFLPWLGSIGAGVLAWILFPGIMPVIIHFFDDTIAVLIESKDYPESVHAEDQPFWPKFWHDIKFALCAIALNILVLPLYLLPVLNLFLFYLLNGYLLGKEFFSMVARRHLSVRDSNALYHRNSHAIIAAGIALTVMATIPVANLFAPFWGIAVMVHLYHRLEQGAELELVGTKKRPLL